MMPMRAGAGLRADPRVRLHLTRALTAGQSQAGDMVIDPSCPIGAVRTTTRAGVHQTTALIRAVEPCRQVGGCSGKTAKDHLRPPAWGASRLTRLLAAP